MADPKDSTPGNKELDPALAAAPAQDASEAPEAPEAPNTQAAFARTAPVSRLSAAIQNAINIPDGSARRQDLEQKVQERTLELAEMIRKLTESKKEVDMALEKERELNNLKSRFISTASHEFRTPLATIMSSVSLTGKYAESMDKNSMSKHIDRVKSSVNHLTDILNDFLSLDKLEEGAVMANPEYLGLNDLLVAITDEIKPIAKAGQRINFTGLLVNEQIFIDKRILKNIMFNLISNAIKYSNENTNIDIKLSRDGNTLTIEIKDQGIGIPLEDQAHIFERFYRANNIGNMQGTGLGLNIVK